MKECNLTDEITKDLDLLCEEHQVKSFSESELEPIINNVYQELTDSAIAIISKRSRDSRL